MLLTFFFVVADTVSFRVGLSWTPFPIPVEGIHFHSGGVNLEAQRYHELANVSEQSSYTSTEGSLPDWSGRKGLYNLLNSVH